MKKYDFKRGTHELCITGGTRYDYQTMEQTTLTEDWLHDNVDCVAPKDYPKYATSAVGRDELHELQFAKADLGHRLARLSLLLLDFCWYDSQLAAGGELTNEDNADYALTLDQINEILYGSDKYSTDYSIDYYLTCAEKAQKFVNYRAGCGYQADNYLDTERALIARAKNLIK